MSLILTDIFTFVNIYELFQLDALRIAEPVSIDFHQIWAAEGHWSKLSNDK